MDTPASPAPALPARRLPGGRARTLVARAVPLPVKVALRRRFRGSWLFPAPPPRPPRGRQGRPARPAPAQRLVRLPVPLAPAGTARSAGRARTAGTAGTGTAGTAGATGAVAGPPSREVVLEAPMGQYVPKRLAESRLVGYEQHALECFLALVGTAGRGAVLDVGANVGLYALLAAATSDRDVRAFEPTPDLAAVARRAAERNDLAVVVEEVALGREAGTATFFLSDRTDSSNSLAEGFRESSRQLDVTVETLDGYCARTGVVPAVLKVDTETTEPDVLEGAAATIAAHRPWIMCEVLHGRREGELAKIMAPHGYTWYHLRGEDDPQPVDTLDGDPGYGDLMYLLAPEPLDADFWALTRAWRAALETADEAALAAAAAAEAAAAAAAEAAAAGAAAEAAAAGADVAPAAGAPVADSAAAPAAASDAGTPPADDDASDDQQPPAPPAPGTLPVRPTSSPELRRAPASLGLKLPDDRLVLRNA